MLINGHSRITKIKFNMQVADHSTPVLSGMISIMWPSQWARSKRQKLSSTDYPSSPVAEWDICLKRALRSKQSFFCVFGTSACL